MAPLVLAIKNEPSFDSRVCVTAQHREMLDSVLKSFDITPDFDLDIMKNEQTLSYITQAVIDGIDRVTDEFAPDVILVHGDTTSAFSAALVGFYKGIKVCHVEAGLRSGDLHSPFPEEFNRRAILAFLLPFCSHRQGRRKSYIRGDRQEMHLQCWQYRYRRSAHEPSQTEYSRHTALPFFAYDGTPKRAYR